MNYVTIGASDTLISGAKSRADINTDSPSDFANYTTMGITEMVKGIGSKEFVRTVGVKDTGKIQEPTKSPAKGANEAVNEINASVNNVKTIDFTELNEIYKSSVYNSDAYIALLGKYEPTIVNGIPDYSFPGKGSSVSIAEKDGYMHFSMGTKWDEIKELQGLTDDMFKLYNELFLDDVINEMKPVKFSHNPKGNLGDLGKEMKYLGNNYYYYCDVKTMTAFPITK